MALGSVVTYRQDKGPISWTNPSSIGNPNKQGGAITTGHRIEPTPSNSNEIPSGASIDVNNDVASLSQLLAYKRQFY